tara:strand:- start:497 stop:670 length:174 start_codon:yes stop_codon:yes gene_type:complete
MRILRQTISVEIENESELIDLVADYEDRGWEMRKRSDISINPINDKMNVTIEFLLRE